MARVYLKKGDIIGCEGYTDLKIVEGKSGVQDYKLHSTEGGDLDYYDEESDTHHKVYMDTNGTPKKNKNWGKFYYEK